MMGQVDNEHQSSVVQPARVGSLARFPRSYFPRLREALSGYLARIKMHDVVRILVALVFLLAALGKGYELLTQPTAEQSLLTSRSALSVVVTIEFTLSLLLAFNLFSHIVWTAGIGCWVLFAAINLLRYANADAQCPGCFGSAATLTPAQGATLDVLLLAAMLRWWPPDAPARPPLIRLAVACLIWIAIIPYATLAIANFTPATLSAEGELIGDSAVVALQPSSWVGQQFPLRRHIDIGDKLAHGQWIVMLYHPDCLACRHEVPRYVALANKLAHRADAPRMALVAIPPHEGSAPPSASGSTACLRGRLSSERRWVVELPLFVRIDEAAVAAAGASTEALGDDLSAMIAETNQPFVDAHPPDKDLGFPDYRRARRDLFLKEIACGPLALIAIFHELKVPLEAEDADRLLSAAGSHGTDLLQLKELAESHGLYALGVKVSAQRLRELAIPAIVHLEGVGFAAATAYTPDGLRVVYPLKPPGILPDDLFARAFGQTGHALLVSRSPLSPDRLGLSSALRSETDGPVLRLSKSMMSVGRIYAHDWQAGLTLYNDGTEALQINSLKPSLDRIRVTLDQATLQPGESTLLRANGAHGHLGSFTYYVELQTNQPDSPSVRIPIRGYVEQPVSFQQPARLVTALAAHSSTHIDVALDLQSGVDAGDLRVNVPEQAPLKADVRQTADGQCHLTIHWLGTDSPGWYRYRLDLTQGDGPNPVKAPFHLAIEVVPEVESFPGSLTIGGEELTGQWSRRLSFGFRRPFDGRYTVAWSNPSFAKAIRVTPIAKSEKLVSFALSLAPEHRDGVRAAEQADFLLELADGVTCKVPMFVREAPDLLPNRAPDRKEAAAN